MREENPSKGDKILRKHQTMRKKKRREGHQARKGSNKKEEK